jgi:hypothetical protein
VGVAIYLIIGGVAVPQLAKALTPAERVALIEKKKDEVHAGLPDEKPEELVAIGRISLPAGAKPPGSYFLSSSSPWTGSTISRGAGSTATYTENHLQDIRVDGHGETLTVTAWIPGFAPAQTQTSPRDPTTRQATFDLKVETGFPTLVKLLDEQGRPISGAKLTFKAVFASGDTVYRQGAMTTDAAGQTSPGNVLPSSTIACEVLAHGFCWNRFPILTFTDGKPTEIRLEKAEPVIGDIIDADTKKPVQGCRAYCPTWNSPRLLVSNGYGGAVDTLPEMAAHPSDAQGHLLLDICHPQDNYVVLCNVPGYQQQSVKLDAGVRSFRAELKRGLVLAGIIRDPDHLLRPHEDKVLCILSSKQPGGSDWRYLPANSEGLQVHFDQLPQGNVSLSCGGGGAWKVKMDRDLTEIEWRVTKKGLVSPNGPPVLAEVHPSPVVKRQVRVHFALPSGAPPMNGKVRVSDHERTWAQEITDSVATMDIAPPAKLNIRPEGVAGWTFNEMDIEVKKGDGPVEKEIEVIPAGAVTGVFRNDPSTTGKPLIGRLLVMDRPKMPSGLPWRNLDGVGLQQFDDKHYYSSLPLHGSYRVVGWTGTAFAESPLLTLDDAHPFLEQDVTFVKGVDVTGHLLQPDGKPCPATVVRFIYQLGDHGVLESVRTGLDGSFLLPKVNFDMSGRYLLVVEASPGIAPHAAPLTKEMKDFKLQRTTGLPLDAVLVDASDKPVSGARLSAVPKKDQPGLSERDRVTSDAPSDGEGRVHFSTLKPGTYSIGVDRGTHEIVQHQLSAGEMAWVELPVKSNEPLRFRVKAREKRK